MSTSNVQTHSGNRIVVTFDGKAVGLLQSVRMNDSYGLEAASGIGDIHVVEHVPTRAVHSLSVSSMVLFKNKLSDAGAAVPENGDGALKGLVFDFISFSRDTGQVLRKYRGCSFDSGDVDVSAHRIVSRSAQYKALDVSGDGV